MRDSGVLANMGSSADTNDKAARRELPGNHQEELIYPQTSRFGTPRAARPSTTSSTSAVWSGETRLSVRRVPQIMDWPPLRRPNEGLAMPVENTWWRRGNSTRTHRACTCALHLSRQ